MSNREFDEVHNAARQRDINLRICPTCKTPREEVAPGVHEWPELGTTTYRYLDRDHPCDCAYQDELRRHYLLAHIPVRYWCLGTSDWFGEETALEAAQAYLDKWDGYREQGIGIEFFSQEMGTGKTFLATYIAKQLIQRRERVYYTRFREIMGLYEAPYDERQHDQERLRHTPVLVLDEVGIALSGPQRDYYASEFEALIRSRIDDDRVTIMTTNLKPNALEHEYPRIGSLLDAKQIRHEIRFYDVRREGDVKMLDHALIDRGETRALC